MNDHAATNTQKLNQILSSRGILVTARKAHWQPQGNCWKYPIYDLSGAALTYRYKASDSNAKPKYWWDGQKPDDCHYYLLPGLQEAINQHNGLLYIASGEPDVLAFKSAGIDNVLCWFGETSVPLDLVASLRKLAVKIVTAYPDRDHTGYKAAEKIAAALLGSGIHFHAAALPEYLGDKGDINKLWQHVAFDRDAFRAALANDTQPLEIEPPKPRPQKRKPKYDDNDHRTYYAAIEAALGINAYKGNGWSKKPVACPFIFHEHDDTKPTAHWHRDKHILRCFKCGETYLAKQVGAALGIDWKDFTAAPDHLPRPTLEAPADNLYHFPQGIPDTLRQILLKLHHKTSIKDHAPALIVLELRQQAIKEQHLTSEEPLTANWLINYAARINWNTSGGVIRRGLKQLAALGFLEIGQRESDGKGRPTDHYYIQPLTGALPRLRDVLRYRIRERIFGDTIPDTVTEEWFTEQPPESARKLAELKNSHRQALYDEHDEARQRAEQQYQREVEAVERRFTLDALLFARCTPLVTDLPCRDSRDYRALYYRSQIIAAGEEGRTITRVKAAHQLGVSSKTLSTLRLKAGIATDEQFETMEITTPENVLDTVNEQFPWAAGHDFGRFLDNGQGNRKGLFNRPEEIDRWAKNEIDSNRTVTVYIQTASRERLANEQELLDKSRIYEDRRERQRNRSQSRPSAISDKPPSLLEEILAHAIEEACPPTFSTAYILRQLAMIPFSSRSELLALIDLFSNLRPLREAYISRGGKNENKSEQSSSGGMPIKGRQAFL